MKSIFDYNEVYEDEDVREANNAKKVMWATVALAVVVIVFFYFF